MKILNNRSEINVIEKSYKYEIKVKGSRFFGFAFPAENEEEIYHKLKRLKKEYYDASHHCYAYKLTDNFKYSDAGEPSGTAGIRILNAIDHYDLVNILIVIVRYFGGTKLGAGNLGRTYYESAIKVLAKADIKKKYHIPQDLYGSYSLEAFGYRVGLPIKVENEDWSIWTPIMQKCYLIISRKSLNNCKTRMSLWP